MANNLFVNPNYLNLISEFETIAELYTYKGDKFAIVNGQLEISPGGFSQAATRTVKNLFKGGYNRDDVLEHLESLAERSAKVVAELFLRDSEQIKENPVDVKLLKQRIRRAATVMSDLEAEYRGVFINKNDATRRFSILFDRFQSHSKLLDDGLKGIKMPDYPRPPIDYNSPVRERKIKYAMPKWQTPEDILKLAESAEKQLVPRWKKIGSMAVGIFATAIVTFPLSFLQTFKWVVWNPVEFLIKRKVTTQAPLQWWTANITNWMNKYGTEAPEGALGSYSIQLLRAPCVTDEHIQAFSQLAKYSRREIDINYMTISSNNVDELLMLTTKEVPFEDMNFGPGAREFLAQQIGDLQIPAKDFDSFVKTNVRKLMWIDDLHFMPGLKSAIFEEWKAAFKGNTLEDRKAYVAQTISLKDYVKNEDGLREKKRRLMPFSNLLKALDIIGNHKNCREVRLPHELREVAIIQQKMLEIGFESHPQFPRAYFRVR